MNHIALTVADLKTERQRLDDMIAALERYNATRNEAETIPQPLAMPVRKKYKIRAKLGVVRGAHRLPPPAVPIETNGGQSDGLLNTAAIEKTIVKASTEIPSRFDSDKATTVSGAMKQIMLSFIANPLTSRQIEEAIKAQYPDLAHKVKLENITANLYYWESKLNVVKIGTGTLATWKVNKSDFFKVLVED